MNNNQQSHKKANNQQRGSGSNQSQQQQKKQSADRTKSLVGQFANALIKSDENTLNKMARYSQGAIGSAGGNVSKLQAIGANGISSISTTNGTQAFVQFTKNNEAACIGVFDAIGDKYVDGSWKIYTPA